MRDLKTYPFVALVISTPWFGALASLLIEINRVFPIALAFLLFLVFGVGRNREDYRYN